jgi:hypothetical protein
MAAVSENKKVTLDYTRFVIIFNVLQARIPHFFTRG